MQTFSSVEGEVDVTKLCSGDDSALVNKNCHGQRIFYSKTERERKTESA